VFVFFAFEILSIDLGPIDDVNVDHQEAIWCQTGRIQGNRMLDRQIGELEIGNSTPEDSACIAGGNGGNGHLSRV
jgi:hypothetical protein